MSKSSEFLLILLQYLIFHFNSDFESDPESSLLSIGELNNEIEESEEDEADKILQGWNPPDIFSEVKTQK